MSTLVDQPRVGHLLRQKQFLDLYSANSDVNG